MQAWWTPTGFLLEYQDGGVANHFQTTRHDLTVEEIAAAFEGYVSGDESAWRTRLTFERIDPRPPAYLVGIRVGRFVRAWLPLIGALVLLALIAWLQQRSCRGL